MFKIGNQDASRNAADAIIADVMDQNEEVRDELS